MGIDTLRTTYMYKPRYKEHEGNPTSLRFEAFFGFIIVTNSIFIAAQIEMAAAAPGRNGVRV